MLIISIIRRIVFMSRGDRSRDGPEGAPPDPASHPPLPHGPYGLPGQGWRQTRGS